MITSFADFIGAPLPFLIAIVIAVLFISVIKGVYNFVSSFFERRRYRRLYGKVYSEGWRIATKRPRRRL